MEESFAVVKDDDSMPIKNEWISVFPKELTEDTWLVFVMQNWKTINDILSWKSESTGGEKRKFDEESRGKPYYMKCVQQMEGRRQRLYDLRESILTRQRDETDVICL
jgi:hypothetical protein